MADNESNGPQLVDQEEQIDIEQPETEQVQEQETPPPQQVCMPRCMGCGAQPLEPVLMDLHGCINMGIPIPKGTVLKAVSCKFCGGTITFITVRQQGESAPLIATAGSMPRLKM